MKWNFKSYPAILEDKTDHGTYTVEVFGVVHTHDVGSMFSPQVRFGDLIAFRQTDVELCFGVNFMPADEFEKQFSDYELRE